MLTVIFLGIVYGFFITKTIRKLEVSIHEISERCYLPVKEYGAFADLFSSLNELDATIKVSDKLQIETEQLRREWIANITHDLKTPLSPIKGYAEILQNDDEKTVTEYRRYAQIMLKNVTYMEKLIDDLKLTWQLESDMIPIDRKEQNLIRFLRELSIDILNCPEYEERTILFEEPDEGISFSFDTKLFTRAFQNLIINAFVHGNEDTIVTLKIAMKDNCLDISVSDNGNGMKPEEAERLFERYYKGTSTDNTAGTGLGLAIAKNIIELHDGIIGVSSAVGSGTSFGIHFWIN